MTDSNSIYSTLQGLLTSSAGQQVLQLAKNQFPGPIQSVLNFYLNGITLPLGPDASLQVDPSSQQLNLQARIGSASLDLQATPNGASLTLSSNQYPDAKVVLNFSNTANGVNLELNASMGATLQWPLENIWPQMLNWTPANQVTFTNGNLNLSIQANSQISFTGKGSIVYGNTTFLNAALCVQHTDTSNGVLFGVVVESWTPGTLWQPLSILTFNHSGLAISSLTGKSNSLVSLGLISAQDVPALQANFDIAPGFLFFTSLQLSGGLQAIANFMGNTSQLDLFAAFASSGDKQLKAILTDSFSPQSTGVFEFDNFTLEWDDPSQGNSKVTASANGQFHPAANTAIDVSLSGSIEPTEGDLSLTFALKNWNQPFGLSTVSIEDLQAGVTVGAQAGGVTLNFGGAIKLQNPNAPQYEFEVGFEAEVVDFEAPNGIALWTQADQAPMTLSNVLDAAFALDFSPQAFQNAGEPLVADVVQFIDNLISVKQFTFWFVEGASLQQIGTHGPFPPGFGLQAQFTLLGQENVQVSVTLSEQGNNKAGFSGYILLQQPITWGSVFTLSGWNEQTLQPSSQGPQLAIAATPGGITVPGVNGGNPVRFYSSLYLEFLDVVQDHLYALASTDNQFVINYAVQNGQQTGGCGAWAGDSVQFMLNPSARQMGAAFSFNFGWNNLSWGGITLWGIQLIPSITLPNFNVAAGLSLSASLQSLVVTGYFDFDLFGIHLNLGSASSPYSLINVNISGVISKLQDIATQLLATLKQQASALLQAALNTLDAFLSWAKAQWKNFVNGLQLVGQILKNVFNQVEAALVNLLKGLGAAAAEVQKVMVALGYALEEVEEWIGGAFGCAIKQASNLLP